MKNALTEWKPEQFEGTDLLPMSQQATDLVQLAEGEEKVGDENVEAEDLVLPVLSLIHGMSKAITEKIEGAQVGLFHMSVTNDIFKPPLRVLFVHHSKSRAMFIKEKDARYKGLERCVSRDGVEGDHYGDCIDCGKSSWKGHTKENPPLCAASHNFVVWTPKGYAVLRCRVSNYKTAKDFVSEFKSAPVNMWHHPVVITTSESSSMLDGEIRTYPVLVLNWIRRETVPDGVREKCREQHELVKAVWEAGRMRSVDDEDDD